MYVSSMVEIIQNEIHFKIMCAPLSNCSFKDTEPHYKKWLDSSIAEHKLKFKDTPLQQAIRPVLKYYAQMQNFDRIEY